MKVELYHYPIIGMIVLLLFTLFSANPLDKIEFTSMMLTGTGGINISCFQEYATIATACGGLRTGDYRIAGDWSGISSYTFDGDYDTSATGANNSSGQLYITYSKPEYSRQGSIWRIAQGANLTNSTFTNITINTTCWNWSTQRIKLRLDSYSNVSGNNWIEALCYNGTWVLMQNFTTNNTIYEEAIYWNISYDINITDNIAISFAPTHPYETNVTPTLQNSTTPSYYFNNTVASNKNVTVRISNEITGFDLYASRNETGSCGAILLNATSQVIQDCNSSTLFNYTVNSSGYGGVWLFANFSNPQPRKQSFSIVFTEVD